MIGAKYSAFKRHADIQALMFDMLEAVVQIQILKLSEYLFWFELEYFSTYAE